MTHLLSYIAQAPDAGERLDALLAIHKLYASRSVAATAIVAQDVYVNGSPARKKYLVKQGDLIVYRAEAPRENIPLSGEPIELDIRYEDDELLVISKPADLVCHPSVDHETHTLVNALIFHCGAHNLCNIQGQDNRLGIVHRLDRDTTGLMLAAKTDRTGLALMDAIRERSIERHYLALVHGRIAPDHGMVDAPIARSFHDRTRMAVRDSARARQAITTFEVLERFEGDTRYHDYTLIDCKLTTGRTHQIRVHMEYTRHPVVGDPVYAIGAPKIPAARLDLSRQFLHSFELSFTHPITGTSLSFVDALPADLQGALMKLSAHSRGRTPAGIEVFKRLEAHLC